MAVIRKIEIRNFRGIQYMEWMPAPGINCLIGPGDSGKSSILDAIDFCLGARRSIQISDADFYSLNVDVPIVITVTLGLIDDSLKNLETYGLYLRSFDPDSGQIEDEPEAKGETVLTVRLVVEDDLEPSWTLVSNRAESQGHARFLSWGDRVRLAPTRIGVMADYHMTWRHGSVLHRLTDERAEASATLARAARDARESVGDEAQEQLIGALAIVTAMAQELGIPAGDVRAMLDAQTVTMSGGTISLHNEGGIPLRGLGTGSSRLLVAGLQRAAAQQAAITLLDELEYGLEPHRIIRLLGSLGANDQDPTVQVLATTHSPVAVRELSGSQLWIVRAEDDAHTVQLAGTQDAIQSTMRLFPEAFLATSVIVCEGASEVGLIRGLDQYRIARGAQSILAQGVSLVDSGGGEPERPLRRAESFRSLGYRAAVVRDDDRPPDGGTEHAFTSSGGEVIAWRDGRALEDELFSSLPAVAVDELIDKAIEIHGDTIIDDHIKSISNNNHSLNSIRAECLFGELNGEMRAVLGAAARVRRQGWFKSISWMEDVARTIVGPQLENADPEFRQRVERIFEWAADGYR